MKKKIFYAVVLLALCVCLFTGCSFLGIFNSKEKYVGTNSYYDVVVELNNRDNTFELTETVLRTNEVTVARGVFEKLGTNESVIKFTFENNYVLQCEIMVNIHGTPFISFTRTSLSGYPPYYKQ